MAWQQCSPTPGLTFHSDQDRQYTSHEFQRLLQRHGLQAVMSGTGNCYDNAVVESFFSSLKMELGKPTLFPSSFPLCLFSLLYSLPSPWEDIGFTTFRLVTCLG